MRYRRKSYARIGTPYLESCISSKFVKIHISLGRYGLISHPHITPQIFFHSLFFPLEIMLGKLYQFKICQNPYLPREIWTHITPPYHTPDFFFILSFFHLKLCWETFCALNCIKHFFFSIKIYDTEIMIWQFSYHTPYQPSTSVSARDSHISPRAFGPQADMGVSG